MNPDLLTITTFTDPTFGENAYVISLRDTDQVRDAWVIDPGLGGQAEQLLAYTAQAGLTVEKILLTHGHADHMAGVDTVKRAFPDAAILIGAEDEPMLADADLNLSAPFGFDVKLEASASANLNPDDTLELGPLTWKILDTAGHSPGGRSLYCEAARVVFTGDALFAGSIGRTDFPGSDHAQLIRNIREQLLSLPVDTVVYSGHGPKTTIAIERKSNPFLSD